jgi:hypothetical protein
MTRWAEYLRRGLVAGDAWTEAVSSDSFAERFRDGGPWTARICLQKHAIRVLENDWSRA